MTSKGITIQATVNNITYIQFTFNNINYRTTTGSTVSVNVNTSASGSITIPSTVTNNSVTYTVTGMVNQAFADSTISSITLPSTLTIIDYQSFKGCTSLTSVNLSQCVNLTTISYNAFAGCSGLTSIDFSNCIKLQAVLDAFPGCSNLSSVNFSNCVEVIDFWGAFRSSSQLTHLSVDLSPCIKLKSLMDSFRYSAIKSVVFPSGVTDLFGELFYECLKLTTITFTGTVLPTIYGATECFYNIKTGVIAYMPLDASNNPANSTSISIMRNINYPPGKANQITIQTTFTNILNYTILPNLFVSVGINTTATGSLTIPSTVVNASANYTVKDIGNNAFSNTSISSITLPSSVITIGNNAFLDCSTNLTTADFSQCVNLTTIGTDAFKNCLVINSIDFSPCKMNVLESTFENSGIQTVKFPQSLTNLNGNLFKNCTRLQKITFTGNLLPTISPTCFTDIRSGVIARITYSAFTNPVNKVSIKAMTSNNPPITIEIFDKPIPEKKWIGGNRDSSNVVMRRRQNAIIINSTTPGPQTVNTTDNNVIRHARSRLRGSGNTVPPKVTGRIV
jgi:hypothetical protein